MALVARLEKKWLQSCEAHTYRPFRFTVQSKRSENCRDFPAAAFAESTSRFTAKANIRGAIIGRNAR
jgi:hypothetical protein